MMGGAAQTEPATPDQAQGGVMMEISKGRLKRVQKALQEKFRDMETSEHESDRVQKKVKKNLGKKSPFSSPLD